MALTVALAASTATAWGGTTITLGPPSLSGFTTNAVGCSPSNFAPQPLNCFEVIANLSAPAGQTLVVPDDGTVTAWRAVGPATSGSLERRLQVLRPAGGGAYMLPAGGQSTDGTLDGNPNTVNPQIPVQPGDLLGAFLACQQPGDGIPCFTQLYTQSPVGAAYGLWTASAFPGSPQVTDTKELGFNATVNLVSPVVTSLSQASGGISGGNTLTITGQHLANATSVSFGSPVTTPVSNTNGQIVVTVPHGETTQTVHVQVTTAGGTSAISSADQYTYLAERGLHVSVSGSGTVTGNGISCPGDCDETYLDGTQVSLSAAAGSGSTFTGWGGACSGTGSCDLTMGGDHDVSAAFAGNPPPPKPPDTRISQATIDSAKGKATFKFKAVGQSSRFQCAVKRKGSRAKPPPKACSSPKTYKHLKPGRYLFAVRAVGPGGADPTPAKKHFKIG